jgi:polysaccharide biosynthesis/export protein
MNGFRVGFRAFAARSTAFVIAGAMGIAVASAADGSADGASVSLKMSAAIDAREASAARAAADPVAAPRMRAAVAKDYRIGVDDLLDIQVFGIDQLSRSVRVNSSGSVSLPLIGALPVGGLTAQEAEMLVASKLRADYLQDPQVSVFIKEFTTQRVTVEGAVSHPGVYPLRGETTLLRSIAIAGGQGNLADLSAVMLFRTDAGGKRTSMTYDIERIRRGEIEDPTVLNDDMIVVNRAPSRVVLKDSVWKDMIDFINPFSPFAR